MATDPDFYLFIGLTAIGVLLLFAVIFFLLFRREQGLRRRAYNLAERAVADNTDLRSQNARLIQTLARLRHGLNETAGRIATFNPEQPNN